MSFVDNIPVTTSDKDTLIRTIIGEAAGEGADGQAAVAHVILNRVKDGSYGNSITDVAKAPYQFSAWNDIEEGGNNLINTSKNSAIYKQVEQVVDNILNGSVPDPTGNATHYWNPKGVKDGKPYWGDEELSKHVNGGVTIGNHIFAGAVNPNADFTVSLTPNQVQEVITGQVQNSTTKSIPNNVLQYLINNSSFDTQEVNNQVANAFVKKEVTDTGELSGDTALALTLNLMALKKQV